MPEPIDYVSLIHPPNLAQSLGGGLEAGNMLHDAFSERPKREAFDEYRRRAIMTAMEQQQQHEADWNTDLTDVLSNPTPDGYQQLFAKYGDKHEQLKSSWGVYNEEKQTRNLKAATAVWGYVTAGATDKAIDVVKSRITALKEAGEDTQESDAILNLLESGDPKKIEQAKGLAGLVLSAASDPSKVGATLSDLTKNAESKVVSEGGALVSATGEELYKNPSRADFTLSPGQTRYSGKGGATGGASGGTGAAPTAVGSDGKLDAKSFFKEFVLPHEGGLNPHDANGSPTKYGINQASNPDVRVEDLTEDGAADIFTNKYFAASGAANLPPALAAVHADTAYINPALAKRFLDNAGGDPQKYMSMREAWMGQLIAKDPKKFGPYKKAWTQRNADLRNYASQLAGGGGGVNGGGQGGAVPIASAPAAAGEEALDPGTVSYYAQQILAGGQMPALGMGKAAALSRRQIMNEVSKLAGAQGLNGADQARQIAHYKAGMKQISTLENQAGTIEANETTALSNGQQFLDRSKELWGQSNIPLGNTLSQFYLRHTGDPTVAAADAAWQTFTTEYAKVVAGSPAGGGTLSDSARHEAQATMRGNYSYKQKQAAFNQMKADMANRMAAIHTSINHAYEHLTKQPGYKVEAPSASPSAEAKLPAGAKQIGTYQGKAVYQLPNGKRLVAQ